MQDSIFSKIINGDIPSHKIYEDEYTYAFLDIHPIAPGHTLVVPKKQVEFVWDLEAETYTALMHSCMKIAKHLKLELNIRYIGEQIMGTDVPHAHVHLIPFNKVEEFRNIPNDTVEPDHAALAELAARLAF